MTEKILKIYNLDGSKSLTIDQNEMYKVKVMLSMVAAPMGAAIPEDYCLMLQGKKIPVRKIRLDPPVVFTNAALDF